MLDENLPTFHFRPSTDNPLSTVLFFTQNGSEPAPEYVLQRPDPTNPSARRKYAAALCDPFSSGVVYGEVLIEPEWTQPTLSGAEIRAQANHGAGPATVSPVVPDAFGVLLYNPDQSVSVRMSPGGWNKNDSWEFEMPTQTFKTPSASALDREHDVGPVDMVPRIVFRWKRGGKLSKDMTCYMSGKSVGGRKSKEPDITLALFKAGRQDGGAVTIYEPNLARVEVEDRKGLEVVMLLVAEVIKDLWLMPKNDIFNISGAPVVNNKRKNSRPIPVTAAAPPPAPAMGGAVMSGAIGVSPPQRQSPFSVANAAPARSSNPAIDAETRRLRAMVEQEEREQRERERREKAECEKREKAEKKRIKRMLEEEEREARRREAEVAKETERLRRMYGTQGQDLPAQSSGSNYPALPPRQNQLTPSYLGPGVAPPPRPVSAGPMPMPAPGPFPVLNNWWNGPMMTSAIPGPSQQPGRRRENSLTNDRDKVRQKRSMIW